MFHLEKDEQLKKLKEFEQTFKERSLSLAEGRRLAADLYATGGLYPELLQSFDEALIIELEKRSEETLKNINIGLAKANRRTRALEKRSEGKLRGGERK